MKTILKTSLYILVAVLVGVSAVYATSKLTPPDSVSNTMYSLSDIYNLASGTTATEGTGAIGATPGTIAETGKTLTEAYTAISTEIAKLTNGKIAKNQTAFGFTGTLYGDTDASKVSMTATYPGTAILSIGDAIASNVLAGKYFSNIGASNVLGTMTDRGATSYTPSNVAQTILAGYYNGNGTVATDSNLVSGNIKSGTTIFGVTGNLSSGGGLLKTGETTCYNTDGSIQSPCLAGGNTDGGQDGYYKKGAEFSYTDNGNGTVTDNFTGLMWKKCSEGKTGNTCAVGLNVLKTWTEALSICEADTTASFTDWRLPNIRELFSLIDFSKNSPSINSVFSTQLDNYWSSSTYIYYGSETAAWFVSFVDATLSISDKPSLNFIRCVRG